MRGACISDKKGGGATVQIIIRPLQHRTKKTKKRIKCKGRKKVFWFGLFNLNYINKEIGLSFFLSLPILVYLFFYLLSLDGIMTNLGLIDFRVKKFILTSLILVEVQPIMSSSKPDADLPTSLWCCCCCGCCCCCIYAFKRQEKRKKKHLNDHVFNKRLKVNRPVSCLRRI